MSDNACINIINDKDLMALFNELTPKVQDRIVNTGLKNAARVILNEAKKQFRATQKNKSRTNYKGFTSFFQIKNLRSKEGVILGVKNYKYRFINFGTNPRQYKAKSGVIHSTGDIEKTSFFTTAVESKKEDAIKLVQDSMKTAMEKTIIQYNKKYRKK